ncbi:Zinc finger, RING-type [Corchorus olitorius]|uniref:RING-type E3 ubiquitin transferase n=1 Tax=Corchorus olitorius TaxID=93759 RepID=A0A1R3K779_9ROSI|nr:Zinc finger, RING-type [Corchorus olitorius]
MEVFPFIIFLLFSLHQQSATAQTCSNVDCGDITVDFPFRLSDQPACCGNPNFNLSCRSQYPAVGKDNTIITFPLTGEFNVYRISYFSTPTSLLISDPTGCTPKRLLEGIQLSVTPFQPIYPETYLFFNCSSNLSRSIDYPAINIDCLGSESFSIMAIPEILYTQSSLLHSCLQIAKISVPISSPYFSEYSLDELLLTWDEPHCLSSCSDICEHHGRTKATIYGLIFGLGIPAFFLWVVFLLYYNSRRNHGNYHQHQQNPSVEISRSAEPPQLGAANGLDRSRIEAYPITLLGESYRLPRPNNNTCSICLSEYKAKETIRTITDCDHYFHSNCIDEWLKVNATCPVCRNLPDDQEAA